KMGGRVRRLQTQFTGVSGCPVIKRLPMGSANFNKDRISVDVDTALMMVLPCVRTVLVQSLYRPEFSRYSDLQQRATIFQCRTLVTGCLRACFMRFTRKHLCNLHNLGLHAWAR